MRMLRPLIAAVALFALAGPLAAQVYPSRGETPVTDDAGMIPPVAEAELAERLVALRQTDGVEIAVVTLISAALYTAGEDLDAYARLLSHEWALGDQTDGRAALLIVLRDDREVAIDLGPAYGPEQTAEAQRIIAEVIAPAFRAENYPDGISAAVTAMGAGLVAPAAASPAPAADADSGTDAAGGGGGGMAWLLGLLALPVAGIIALRRRAAAKLAATPCPACGKTGLTRERITLVAATELAEGRGETRTTCPHCGHSTAAPYTISRRSKTTDKSKSSDKGGGTASGGW